MTGAAPIDSAAADDAISVEAVRLRRGERVVFDGLSLRLSERRIGLIGDNGAGKSSLLRLLNGLLLPDAGRVLVNGLDTRAHRAQLPAAVGFLFQNPDHQIIFPTVGEEIAFGLRQQGMDAKSAARAVSALLAAHDMAGWEGRPVHDLSDGQKQRVCLLAVIAPQPAILALDEPFASLDLPTRRAMMRALEALPQRIVMASHDLDLLARFDRVIWMREGAVAADGPARETIARYRAAYTDDTAQEHERPAPQPRLALAR